MSACILVSSPLRAKGYSCFEIFSVAPHKAYVAEPITRRILEHADVTEYVEFSLEKNGFVRERNAAVRDQLISRGHVKTMRAFPLVLVGIIACGQASAAERTVTIKTVTIKVEGMMCGADPHVVRDSLATLKGVKSVAISIENKTVAVIFDDAIVTVNDFVKATSVAGYPSTQLN